jgi:hypothetical protein
MVNRFNVSIIAMNWQHASRYFPSWMEIAASAALVILGVLIFRWIVNRMPVLSHEKPLSGSITLQDYWNDKVAEKA